MKIMENTPPSPKSESFLTDLKNYSGTVINVNQSAREFFFKQHPLHLFLVLVIPVFASILIFSNFVSVGIINSSAILTPIFLACFPLIIPAVSYWRVSSRMESLFYAELATTLNCTYSEKGVTPETGQLFSFGDGRMVTNVLAGTYKDISILLADYRYGTGSGKSRETYYYTISELITKEVLPHIVCIPTAWHSVILDKWKPSENESLTLEGNFNSKFTVYVPKGKEIEALQILEPDVMTKLMDGYDDFGFECVGSNVYLFTTGSMDENRESVISMYTIVQRFCDILLPELQTFSNTSTVQTVPTT
jgi:hypothetical protein